MSKWIGKLLCAIGWHDERSIWLEDGHGNSGSIRECRRCGKVFHEDEFFC